MIEYQNLDMQTLIDMLSDSIDKYIKMVMKGSTKEEFENCKHTLKLIQTEIESRKYSQDNIK